MRKVYISIFAAIALSSYCVLQAKAEESNVEAKLYLYEEGKVWKSKGENLSLPPTIGHTYYTRTDYIHGDTLIDDVRMHMHYTRFDYENGDTQTDTTFVPANVVNNGYFDFSLNRGDFKICMDTGSGEFGWKVTHVSDTILTDGKQRRCLTLDFIRIDKTNEEQETLSQDIWVEGVGSLISGLALDIPITSGGGTHELQSVAIDGRYAYHRLGKTYATESLTAENKLWHCKSTTLGGCYYYIQGDTAINGQSAHKVYVRSSQETSAGEYQGAVYEYGKRVYCCYRGQDQFTLLYDFGVTVGQTVSIGGITYEVDGKDVIELDGEKLIRIHITDTENKEHSNIWIEGFGGLYGPLDFLSSDAAFSKCEVDNEVVLTREEMNTLFEKPSWVGAVWSYVSYNLGQYDFIRYTVLDSPEVINGQTYYPLVKYSTCSYEPEKEERRWRIRQQADKVYILASDSPDYGDISSGVRLTYTDGDYLLYDFAYEKYAWYCTSYTATGYTEIYVTDVSALVTEGGQMYDVIVLKGGDSWIAGIGSTENLVAPYSSGQADEATGTVLNYFCSADGTTIYHNPEANDGYTGFKPEDCAIIEANNIKMNECLTKPQLQPIGQNIFCTSPDASLLEVYTPDAVKVGQSAFHNGEAVVTVSKAPATYLYIVTYPDGRRESGKVMVK